MRLPPTATFPTGLGVFGTLIAPLLLLGNLADARIPKDGVSVRILTLSSNFQLRLEKPVTDGSDVEHRAVSRLWAGTPGM